MLSNYFQTTKVLYLNFNQTSQATAYISIPFQARKVICRSCSYTATTPPVAGDHVYVNVFSNLTGNSVIGTASNGIETGDQSNDISFWYNNPESLRGTYVFDLYDNTGASYVPTGNDYVKLILEFQS